MVGFTLIGAFFRKKQFPGILYFRPMDILQKTQSFVTSRMEAADASHDLWHIRRVVRLAETLHRTEGGDREIILLAAWLHDIADAKFHDGDDALAGRIIRQFLKENHYPDERIYHVENIVSNMSFRHSLDHDRKAVLSKEFCIVSDADKLDAIGAIGIARAFHFGGHKNNPIYDPSIPLHSPPDAESYRKYNRSTIHHFYDKLLKLKDMLHTPTARQMAEERHRFMEMFLDRFFKEWGT